MSMRSYAAEGYGLIINEELFDIIKKKAIEEDPETADMEMYDLFEHLFGYVSCYGDCEGEFLKLDSWETQGDFCADEEFYILDLDKYPSIFKTAYSSMDEVVAEIKGKAGKYLPEDFDYEKHIAHFVGTYFG